MTITITSIEQGLSWLLSRLTWPSIMVRERACVELAALLLHPQLGDVTHSALLHWIAAQRLESLAAVGILPFLRAQMQDDAYNAPLADLTKALHAPSLLAWLLLNELDLGHSLLFAEACQHAETAPQDFTPEPFFAKYVENFLPPGYADLIREVEQHESIALWRQWAFEWQRLFTDLEITPSRDELDDWHRLFPGGEHYAGIDTTLSEVYRSAFLRTLAWAVEQGVHPQIVQFLAAITCPVDLDLWRVAPHVRPTWWPQIVQPKGQIDTTAADIWQQVEALWEQYRTGGGDENTIVAASGIVYHQESIYNLEIFGLFQSCIGPETPELADITAWCSGAANAKDVVLTVDRPSPLRFGGVIANRPPESMQQRFADWLVLPATCPVTHSRSVPRWQLWRIVRDIWLPAPYLAESPLTVTCEPYEMVVRAGENQIGWWVDWADGLGETMIEGVPPKSGQVLSVASEAIAKFAQQRKMTFCWLCKLTGYYRERQSQEFAASFAEQRMYGASRILRP